MAEVLAVAALSTAVIELFQARIDVFNKSEREALLRCVGAPGDRSNG